MKLALRTRIDDAPSCTKNKNERSIYKCASTRGDPLRGTITTAVAAASVPASSTASHA
jgi:hypothetical protein